ncbi:hypothetical protein SAMN06265365_10659 [Tistlia consotensis]|uniref:Uncharacterized protein n=1 Tax=Tistlia consotensis USBA 355 TaxID=560819 RepID=A0A1Y6BCT2_9PROT|nr:hypothetical protein [Tistlia consotensis]SMF03083.1 hypothetical protein SAMN05428998_103110 [Tistlia consotensis USBA 355]SNR53421.1 hypothetical protein SAMN06265365_10659 [Tistlia consotensis]
MPHDYGTAGGSGTIRWTASAATKAKGYGPDPSCQPCPDCGGLECLCRPRFFAGQLLTEQDLNRLDHYIVEKQKLHNRHLFGSGVVCGLAVTCAPCDELVNVSPGYALSPCGEDIVVCKPDSVDICSLISRCRDIDEPDCRPYAGQDPCEDIEEEWILAIRYLERPSAPKTPMAGPSSCACGSGGCKGKGCACGGSCGCSGSAAATGTTAGTASTQQPRLRRGAPPTCEPTVTCESYRYEVFRKPEEKPRDPGGRDPGKGDNPAGVIVASLAGFFDKLEGEMAARIACCLREIEKALPLPPGNFATMTEAERQAWFRWCCAVRSGLSGYFARIGGTDCEAIDRLGAATCPSPDLPLEDFRAALQQSVLAMLGPAFEAMLHCICSNVLPPCPPPEDPRVPLASVTIRKRDCHIVKVCNWTPLRRHVVTFPTLGYWLGWIPLRRILRQLMEQLCCQVIQFGDVIRDGKPDVTNADTTTESATFANAAAVKAATATAGDAFAQPAGLSWSFDAVADPVLAKAFARQIAQPESAGGAAVTRGDLFDLLLRRPAFATAEGLDPADEEKLTTRLAGSGLVKMLAEVARSSEGLLPSGLAPSTAAGAVAQAVASPDLAEMKRSLDAQSKEIAALKARLDAGTAPKSTSRTRTTKPGS